MVPAMGRRELPNSDVSETPHAKETNVEINGVYFRRAELVFVLLQVAGTDSDSA